ncbi:TnpV protein [Dorea formicigenerans]|uniref:TnpV protein n=9 Tax=Bacillota TaxID=1239 RepID=A0A412KV56_9FIRM|nr:TnpV protein [Dorea formicigenerans]
MKKQIYDEKNGLNYTLHGDYYLPDLELNEEEPVYGKYGIMRKQFLKEHRSAKYQYLVLTGKLTEYLNQVDKEAREKVEMNGGVAWLNGHGNDNENIDTYTEFTKDIDTVLMGWNTSHQVVTELSPQEWVYNKFTTYVLTHKECNSSQQIHFTSENPVLLLERLKQEAGKDIWICGGANLVQQLVSKNMIDKYYISVIPTLLGNGVRLLGNIDREIKLRLCKTQTYNGITDLIYMRR